ncbi:hypothetical protein C4K40_4254 [Pseudomonas sp. CMR5c]|nr:hypothetical protein C4K40_4254 [Pseudomonas sp. CMR5c]
MILRDGARLCVTDARPAQVYSGPASWFGGSFKHLPAPALRPEEGLPGQHGTCSTPLG